jgi:osmotically inducible protein OsmC
LTVRLDGYGTIHGVTIHGIETSGREERPMLIRTSEAQWDGGLQEGKGRFWTQSGEVSGVYSFGTRFEDQEGANPEELIGAAHASCFSMALAAGLEKAGHRTESVRTIASVRLEKGEDGFAITRIDLDAEARVPGIEDAEFQRFAEQAKETCPISTALAVPIVLRARLAAA